jgi:hypothetical protein
MPGGPTRREVTRTDHSALKKISPAAGPRNAYAVALPVIEERMPQRLRTQLRGAASPAASNPSAASAPIVHRRC